MTEPTVQDLFDLTGRVAFISGASGYLGSSMSRALAEAGANVVVSSSRDLETAQRAAAELPTDHGNQHYAVLLDQMDESSVNEGFDAALTAAGKLDILINNGHFANGEDLTSVGGDDFTRQLSNATGWFLLARRFRDHIVERQASGSVIMIGSMYGVVGSYPDAYEGICNASPVAYHTLKGGVIHMTRHLAVYWARDNVRVNCLSPGPFPSEKAPAGLAERLNRKSPMNRMGLPHELKGAMLLFASDAGSYITGQNLIVDGGWTAW